MLARQASNPDKESTQASPSAKSDMEISASQAEAQQTAAARCKLNPRVAPQRASSSFQDPTSSCSSGAHNATSQGTEDEELTEDSEEDQGDDKNEYTGMRQLFTKEELLQITQVRCLSVQTCLHCSAQHTSSLYHPALLWCPCYIDVYDRL